MDIDPHKNRYHEKYLLDCATEDGKWASPDLLDLHGTCNDPVKYTSIASLCKSPHLQQINPYSYTLI